MLLIVVGSTRPGRVGLPVAEWFRGVAERHGGFQVAWADLAEIRLPLLDEPYHPRLGRYQHQHTRDWSRRVDGADAFVMVAPEYNYGFNAALKNAIDYLHREWQYKPVGFVSYGGVSGGTRAVQMLKQVVTTLKMVPVNEAVVIPFVQQALDEEGRFQASEALDAAARQMLDELRRWALALQPLRAGS